MDAVAGPEHRGQHDRRDQALHGQRSDPAESQQRRPGRGQVRLLQGAAVDLLRDPARPLRAESIAIIG